MVWIMPYEATFRFFPKASHPDRRSKLEFALIGRFTGLALPESLEIDRPHPEGPRAGAGVSKDGGTLSARGHGSRRPPSLARRTGSSP